MGCMRARALKFVRFDRIEDHFRQGWMILIPKSPMHHHHYSVEMAWLCSCPVPGGFKGQRVNRVPINITQESAHDRAGRQST
jgi:hypothetical protein